MEAKESSLRMDIIDAKNSYTIIELKYHAGNVTEQDYYKARDILDACELELTLYELGL